MAAAAKDLRKKKSDDVARKHSPQDAPAKDAPNPVWFKPVMFGFMLLGLIWIVLYYITSATPMPLPVPAFGQANIFIGFGLVLIGFLMTPWWK